MERVERSNSVLELSTSIWCWQRSRVIKIQIVTEKYHCFLEQVTWSRTKTKTISSALMDSNCHKKTTIGLVSYLTYTFSSKIPPRVAILTFLCQESTREMSLMSTHILTACTQTWWGDRVAVPKMLHRVDQHFETNTTSRLLFSLQIKVPRKFSWTNLGPTLSKQTQPQQVKASKSNSSAKAQVVVDTKTRLSQLSSIPKITISVSVAYHS